MRNWLGQSIKPGDIVGRGARAGNTSDFKLGVVDKIDDKGIRVHWLYEESNYWLRDRKGKVVYPHKLDSYGRPNIHSLFRLTWDDKDRCDVLNSLVQLYREESFDEQQLFEALDRFDEAVVN